MKKLYAVAFAITLLGLTVGCGARENEVIVNPEFDPAEQQQVYEDYDAQQAAEADNYQ